MTQDFVKEWPEVLEGLQFQNMPVKYLLYIDIILKNNLTIHYDIAKEKGTTVKEMAKDPEAEVKATAKKATKKADAKATAAKE